LQTAVPACFHSAATAATAAAAAAALQSLTLLLLHPLLLLQVKEHIGIADSEVYLHHFWGHYLFIPLFFNRGLINWAMPKRWRLPTALLEELATSVRVMARLLWTVHLDYSQVG
jgi:hypothetical protein